MLAIIGGVVMLAFVVGSFMTPLGAWICAAAVVWAGANIVSCIRSGDILNTIGFLLLAILFAVFGHVLTYPMDTGWVVLLVILFIINFAYDKLRDILKRR